MGQVRRPQEPKFGAKCQRQRSVGECEKEGNHSILYFWGGRKSNGMAKESRREWRTTTSTSHVGGSFRHKFAAFFDGLSLRCQYSQLLPSPCGDHSKVEFASKYHHERGRARQNHSPLSSLTFPNSRTTYFSLDLVQ